MVVQSFKTGDLSLMDVPVPQLPKDGILVKTNVSLISSGTDRAVITLAKKNLLDKAKSRPDLVKKVFNKLKNDGVWSTIQTVQHKIDEPLPLGYSLVGEVMAVGDDISHVKVGDRVACAGQGVANHAEIVAVPRNLFVPVPNEVLDEQAAYVTLGAIAMHGLRQANQQMGSTVLVVGLGLVGLITTQLCCAAGLRVIGIDFDPRKIELAKECGAKEAYKPDSLDLTGTVMNLTNGRGFDAVLLTAASSDSGEVFDKIAQLCRDKAKIVIVGDVKMEMTRRYYFQKELEILQSRSYGPGRYDPNYELHGNDYPVGYVRWTENRNMESFLQLIADQKIDLNLLTTHRFFLEEADKAYDLVMNAKEEFVVGILLKYPEETKQIESPPILKSVADKISLGIIGPGQFARQHLIPAMLKTKQFYLMGVASKKGLTAGQAKSRFGAQFATCDNQYILAQEAIDAVIIATRHQDHARLVNDALTQNKHVFVEKPLCLTHEELKEVEAQALRSKGILMVGYNRRFSPITQKIIRFFEGRKEPLSILYRINAGRIPLNTDSAWVHDASGGGRLLGEVCHFVDLCQAIIGKLPIDVNCRSLNPNRADLVGDDCVTLTITYEDGSLATIHYWTNGDTSLPKEYLEVFGQEKIAINDNFRKLNLISGGKSQKSIYFRQQKGYSEEAQAFASACKLGQRPVPLTSLVSTSWVTLQAREILKKDYSNDS